MVKNTRQDTGKCKTIINIDDQNIFSSPAYEWKHPNEDKTEFDIYTGSRVFNPDSGRDPEKAIRNISITSFE